jgi:hypothetical protein
MYIMASDPISTAYFLNPIHKFLSVCSFPLALLGTGSMDIFPRQKIQAIIEELLEA